MARSQFILDVPLLYQRGTRLCWAAAMEMVMKYHQPRVRTRQGELSAEQFRLWSDTPLSADDIGSCNRINVPDFGTFCNLTNEERWNQELVNEDNTQPFDTLFSNFDYYSVSDKQVDELSLHILTWEFVRNQIKKRRLPFILVLGVLDEEGNDIYPTTHAVVVRGIWETEDGERYLYVNDPLHETIANEGYSYSLNFDNLCSDEFYTVIKAITINISRKSDWAGLGVGRATRNLTYQTLAADIAERPEGFDDQQLN
jgi:hypothetical protein